VPMPRCVRQRPPPFRLHEAFNGCPRTRFIAVRAERETWRRLGATFVGPRHHAGQ
jgi:hypothetical protein